jgi:putative transposase
MIDPGRRTLPHRAPIVHANQSIILFVTQVVQGRRPLLTRPEALACLLDSWRRADYWLVGRYILMPDHVHFFCAPNRTLVSSVREWMAYWRSMSSRAWPWPDQRPVWQKDFFDRQLRRQESYAAKWQYVRQNPVRAQLTDDPDDWPWQGEMHRLAWHDP